MLHSTTMLHKLQVAAVSLCLFLALGSLGARAWHQLGHQAIAMTALSSISSKTAPQLKKALGKDLVDVSGWTHKIVGVSRRKGDGGGVGTASSSEAPVLTAFEKWDFLLQPKGGAGESSAAECNDDIRINDLNCKDNQCLVRALQHFYQRLTNTPSPVDLTYPMSARLTTLDALKFFVNLFGELHQPLHFGNLEDEGGKNITVYYTAPVGTEQRGGVGPSLEETTLFDYWDSKAIAKFAKDRPGLWWGGWTHVHQLGPRLIELKEEWNKYPKENKHQLFEVWGLESYRKACSAIYPQVAPDPVDNADEDFHAVAPTPAAAPFVFTLAHDAVTFDFIRRQIVTAGARLAMVLDTIFDLNKDLKGQLRPGSAIITADDTSVSALGGAGGNPKLAAAPGGGQYVVVSQYKLSELTKIPAVRSFLINLCIIIVVLAVLAYVFKYYTPSLTVASPASTILGRQVQMAKRGEKGL